MDDVCFLTRIKRHLLLDADDYFPLPGSWVFGGLQPEPDAHVGLAITLHSRRVAVFDRPHAGDRIRAAFIIPIRPQLAFTPPGSTDITERFRAC